MKDIFPDEILASDDVTREISLLKSKRVGILEDDPDQIKLMKKYLEGQFGNDVEYIYCQSKDEAVVEFLGQELDFVILDINIPEPQGFAIGKVLRGFSDFALPIIYTSANHKYIKQFCSSGQQDIYFLPKPFSQEQLLTIVESIYSRQT